MKVSYTWLQTYFKRGFFGSDLPKPAKLAELFSAHAFEVEGMEKTADGDSVFDIKVLPDRAHYALSHRGIAGEAAAIAKLTLKAPVEPKIVPDGAVGRVAVNVTDVKLCPRYMARRVEGVRVGPSPRWLSERLEAIGQRSINNVVDALNYVMFDVGQPLHAFDADKIVGAITVRPTRTGERITLLDEREVALLESDLLIADDAGPLVIAGVKGGKRAEVTETTTSIVIESANFNPTTVRRTSTRLNLRNDSSKRFENEITPALAETAMEEVTALIQKLCTGAHVGAVTDVYPAPVVPRTIAIDPKNMNAITGLNLDAADMTDILKRLQCDVVEQGGKLLVTPPLVRLDLVIPEDIADELARMYGYDRLESRQTPDVSAVPVDKTFYWSEKIKNILVAQGFSETLLYTLVPKGDYEIIYPLAKDKAALRKSIVPKMMDSLSLNAVNAPLLGSDAIKIFEIGKVFQEGKEITALCLGVTQIKKKKGVTDQSLLLEAMNDLHRALGIPEEISLKFSQGGNPVSGAVTEIVLDALIQKLPEPGKLSDLDFKALSADKKYKPFSPYPFIARDVALFVPAGTNDVDVLNTIKASATKAAGALLVKGPDLFDRFEKPAADGAPARVSYAYRMIFQSFERTLSDDEVNGWMEQVYSALRAKNWQTR